MAEPIGGDLDEDLEAVLALLASPGAVVVPRAGGTALPRDISGDELVELVELTELGLASIERTGDRIAFGAMVRLRELADAFPEPLAGLVRSEVADGLLDRATVGGTVMAGGPVSPLLTGLLACEAVVTLSSRRIRHDLPLAALLVGPTPPRDTLVLSVRLDLDGEIGLASGATPNGHVVRAVARRTSLGRLLVAMSGVAPGPILVRDPDDVRRTIGHTVEHDLVRRVHADAVADIGRGVALPAPTSGAPHPVRDETTGVERRGIAVVEPGEPLPDDAEVVVIRAADAPPYAVLGRVVIDEPVVRPVATVASTIRLDAPGSLIEVVQLVGERDGDEGPNRFESVLRVDPAGTTAPAETVVAELDGEGRLVVRTGAVDPFAVRRAIAEQLDVGAARLRVVSHPGATRTAPHPIEVEVARVALTTRQRVEAVMPAAVVASMALTAESTSESDGELVSLQVSCVAGETADPPERARAIAWAAELHRAALQRRSGLARAELDGAESASSWDEMLAGVHELVGAERRHDPDWRSPGDRPTVVRGVGFAVAPPEPDRPSSVSATVSWAGGSSFLVAVTIGDSLDGRHRGLTSIAAEVLGVDPSLVTVLGGDTDRVPPGELGGGAGFAVSAMAVRNAADDLRRRFQRRAAPVLGTQPSRVVLEGGSAVAPDGRSVSFAEIAVRASASSEPEPLVGSGFGQSSPERAAAGGLVAASVEVDLATGDVTVLDLVVGIDAGMVVHPLGAGRHVREALAEAAAAALGRPLSRAAARTALFVESVDDLAPLGARSLGGVPERATLPALHAAIVDATGAELTVAPFSAGRVRAALLEAS